MAATRVTESGADPSGASSPAGVERNHGMASGSSHPTAVSSEALRDSVSALLLMYREEARQGVFLYREPPPVEPLLDQIMSLVPAQSPSAPTREVENG